jgi:hypothetical protein
LWYGFHFDVSRESPEKSMVVVWPGAEVTIVVVVAGAAVVVVTCGFVVVDGVPVFGWQAVVAATPRTRASEINFDFRAVIVRWYSHPC